MGDKKRLQPLQAVVTVLRLNRVAVVGHMLYLAVCWSLVSHPNLAQHLPGIQAITSRQQAADRKAGFHLALHLPKTRAAAWQLGHLACELQTAGANESSILLQAAKLLHVKHSPNGTVPLTPQHLAQLKPLLDAAENAGNTPVKRLLGLLSLVNLMWLAGIAGLTFSIGPVVVLVLGPVLARLGALVLPLLTALAAILVPLVVQLVKTVMPLLPAVVLLPCVYLVAAASSFGPSAAAYVALTGQCLAAVLVPAFMESFESKNPDYRLLASDKPCVWSTAEVANQFIDLQQQLQLQHRFQHSYVAFVVASAFAATAAAHQSRLAGFLAVVALFAALGFTVTYFGMGWQVGWESEEELHASQTASAVLVVGLLVCKWLGPPVGHRLLAPFQLGVSVMGAHCFFLAALVKPFDGDGKGGIKGFLHDNLGFLTTNIGCIIISALLGLDSLRNTALTYLLLWASAKLSILISHWGVWLSIFVTSLGLWFGGLQLSRHPGVLAGLFDL